MNNSKPNGLAYCEIAILGSRPTSIDKSRSNSKPHTRPRRARASYECAKRQLPDDLSPEEYTAEIRKIADRLGE